MRPATPQQSQSQASSRTSSRGGRKREGYPFLTKDKLSMSPKLFKVIECREQPDNFKPDELLVMVKIALEGVTTLWPLRYTNPCLEVLQQAWGLDEKEWAGQTGSVFLSEPDFEGKQQTRVKPDEMISGRKRR